MARNLGGLGLALLVANAAGCVPLSDYRALERQFGEQEQYVTAHKDQVRELERREQALTLRLREHGAMRAAISTMDLEPSSLVARVRSSPGMAGADLARTVTSSIGNAGRAATRPGSRNRSRPSQWRGRTGSAGVMPVSGGLGG